MALNKRILRQTIIEFIAFAIVCVMVIANMALLDPYSWWGLAVFFMVYAVKCGYAYNVKTQQYKGQYKDGGLYREEDD